MWKQISKGSGTSESCDRRVGCVGKSCFLSYKKAIKFEEDPSFPGASVFFASARTASGDSPSTLRPRPFCRNIFEFPRRTRSEGPLTAVPKRVPSTKVSPVCGEWLSDSCTRRLSLLCGGACAAASSSTVVVAAATAATAASLFFFS